MNIYRNWRDAGQRWWEVVIRPLGHTKLNIFFSAFVFFHLLQEWVLKLIRPFTNHESTTNHFPNIFNRTSSALYISPAMSSWTSGDSTHNFIQFVHGCNKHVLNKEHEAKEAFEAHSGAEGTALYYMEMFCNASLLAWLSSCVFFVDVLATGSFLYTVSQARTRKILNKTNYM